MVSVSRVVSADKVSLLYRRNADVLAEAKPIDSRKATLESTDM
jgi:hypothetical protein